MLTRNGRPAAVIMSPQDLEALELLSDPGAMADIAQEGRPGWVRRSITDQGTFMAATR